MSIPDKIIIIGTGPAALMAGTVLLERGFPVVFYEQKKAAGRKFLVAGHGGFNLSNSIDKDSFLDMYDRSEVRAMVDAFDAEDLVLFFKNIGISTYIGSSGKLFPEPQFKPIDVLNAWLNFLRSKGASFYFGTELVDFDEQFVWLKNKNEVVRLPFHKLVLGLGGASWPQTGSTGAWTRLFATKNIAVKPFKSSNAGFNIAWTGPVKAYQGIAIKHVSCRLGQRERYGEIVLTEYGLEGAPVFYLNGAYRSGYSTLYIDAKPGSDIQKIIQVLKRSKNNSEGLKVLKISKPLLAYIKGSLSRDAFVDPERLAHYIKNMSFSIDGLRPVNEAISTVGGLAFEALTEDLALKQFPNIYCCGEMLDWDAPTGGYLLQACFASGNWTGKHII